MTPDDFMFLLQDKRAKMDIAQNYAVLTIAKAWMGVA